MPAERVVVVGVGLHDGGSGSDGSRIVLVLVLQTVLVATCTRRMTNSGGRPWRLDRFRRLRSRDRCRRRCRFPCAPTVRPKARCRPARRRRPGRRRASRPNTPCKPRRRFTAQPQALIKDEERRPPEDSGFVRDIDAVASHCLCVGRTEGRLDRGRQFMEQPAERTEDVIADHVNGQPAPRTSKPSTSW